MTATLDSFVRHKWKFVIVTMTFWAAAAAWYFLTDPPYVSEAKVLVSYVVDLDIDGPSRQAHDSIVKAEIETLTSREMAERVVKEIGADRLVKGGGEAEAVSVISGGLVVSNEKKSPVIQISFRHPDADTAQAVLQALMKSYFLGLSQIHRSANPTANSSATPVHKLLRSLAFISSAAVFAKTTSEIEADLIPGKQIPNIAIIQTPTPATPDPKHRHQILIGMVAAGPVIALLVVLILRMLGTPRKEDKPSVAPYR